MRRLSVVICVIAFAFVSNIALAAARQETVNLPRAATVGNTQLAAGDYNMEWSDDTAVVQVTFTKGKKTIATSPARIVSETNRLGGISLVKRDGVDVLESVRTKNASLYFDVSTASTK